MSGLAVSRQAAGNGNGAEPISCEFELAYVFVCEVAAVLRDGGYYRDTEGRPLWTLDEVVRAAREGRWPVVEQVEKQQVAEVSYV